MRRKCQDALLKIFVAHLALYHLASNVAILGADLHDVWRKLCKQGCNVFYLVIQDIQVADANLSSELRCRDHKFQSSRTQECWISAIPKPRPRSDHHLPSPHAIPSEAPPIVTIGYSTNQVQPLPHYRQATAGRETWPKRFVVHDQIFSWRKVQSLMCNWARRTFLIMQMLHRLSSGLTMLREPS